MTGFECDDIVLVPLPFTDQSAAKKQPVAVISSAAYQRERPDIIIIAVTSQVKPAQTLGVVVIKDWQDAVLLKPSVIKTVNETIEKPLVISAIGWLKNDSSRALKCDQQDRRVSSFADISSLTLSLRA